MWLVRLALRRPYNFAILSVLILILGVSSIRHHTRCLIADIQMPGMSGLDLQAQLKAARYRIPIIFITAHGDERIRLQAMSAGAVKTFRRRNVA